MNVGTLFTAATAFVAAVAQAVGSARRRRMISTTLAVLVHVTIGFALVAAMLWWGNAVYSRFLARDEAPRLAPVAVMGIADAEKAKLYEDNFPRMVLAHLEQLKGRTNTAIEALRAARTTAEDQVSRPADLRFREIPVPAAFDTPVEIAFKVGEVDIGPILSLLWQRSQDDNVLNLTFDFDEKEGKADVLAHSRNEQYVFVARARSTNPTDVAKTAAAAIIQQSTPSQEGALALLDGVAFSEMIESLGEYAHLEKFGGHVGQNSPGVKARYEALWEKLKPHAESYTGWSNLQWLAAKVAERAQAWEDAQASYERLLPFLRVSDPEYDLVSQRIERLRDRQRSDALSASGVSVISAAETASASPIDPAFARGVLEQIGLSAPLSAEGIRIGIVGGAPDLEAFKDVKIELLPIRDGRTIDSSLRQYESEVLQTIRLVAPDATFVYAQAMDTTSATLRDMLDGLTSVSVADVDVILTTFGGFSPSSTEPIYQNLARLSVFVLAAGNQPGETWAKDLTDVAFVAAATARDGAAAYFSSSASNVFWAPGVDIPVAAPGGGVALRRGTSFSAALLAGAVAVLQHDFPDAGPADIRAALHETARPVQGRTEPKVINVGAAREHLRKQFPKT